MDKKLRKDELTVVGVRQGIYRQRDLVLLIWTRVISGGNQRDFITPALLLNLRLSLLRIERVEFINFEQLSCNHFLKL